MSKKQNWDHITLDELMRVGQRGYDAFGKGWRLQDNPFKTTGDPRRMAWSRSYVEARAHFWGTRGIDAPHNSKE